MKMYRSKCRDRGKEVESSNRVVSPVARCRHGRRVIVAFFIIPWIVALSLVGTRFRSSDFRPSSRNSHNCDRSSHQFRKHVRFRTSSFCLPTFFLQPPSEKKFKRSCRIHLSSRRRKFSVFAWIRFHIIILHLESESFYYLLSKGDTYHDEQILFQQFSFLGDNGFIFIPTTPSVDDATNVGGLHHAWFIDDRSGLYLLHGALQNFAIDHVYNHYLPRSLDQRLGDSASGRLAYFIRHDTTGLT